MSRENFLILFGVLIALTPFAGIPQSWLMWVLPILGLVVAGIGTTLRTRRRILERHTQSAHAESHRV